MKSYKGIGILVFAGIQLLFLGCSNDDNNPIEIAEAKLPDYTVIGENFQGVFQFNYDGLNNEIEEINLTEDNNVLREYLTLRQVSETLTFFIFSSGKFSAVQRNYKTGETNFINEFYTNTNERSIIWGATSESKIFMANYSPRGSTNLGLRVIDLLSGEEDDLMVEFDVESVYQPLYAGGKLLLGYLDSRSNYKLAILDSNSNTLVKTFDFGQFAPSIFITEDNNIGIISANNDSEYDFAIYDIDNLESLREESFILNRYFSPGAIQTQAQFLNEKLYYLNFYAQPSIVNFGPAFYDFNIQENRIIDMLSIAEEINNELGLSIELSAFDYDKESNTFLIGYSTFESPDILRGGVLIISTEGDLLEHDRLDFAPDYFVR